MSPIKVNKTTVQNQSNHLCWDCTKAGIPDKCEVYESLTGIIEKNFEKIKILFNIPECEFFEADTQINEFE